MTSNHNPHWQILLFNEFSPELLYSCMAARQNVFVIEQQCLFPDLDGKDHLAFHLVGSTEKEGNDVIAYARIFLPGVLYEPASIGRILTTEKVRGQGVGKMLVARCIKFLKEHNGNSAIRISAQQHLTAFYETFGFESISSPYLDDGIWHIDMMLWPD